MNVLFLSSHAMPAPADLAAHPKGRNQKPMPNAVPIPEGPVRALDQVFELWLPFQHVRLRSRSGVEVWSHQRISMLGVFNVRANEAPDLRVVRIGRRRPGPGAIRKVGVPLYDLADLHLRVK